MLIATLFTTAKIWKQPKCPSTDERIKKMSHTHTHTHTGILLSHKKNERMPLAKNVYVLIPRGYYAQCNKSDGERQILCYHLYVKSRIIKQICITKHKEAHKYREQTIGYQ